MFQISDVSCRSGSHISHFTYAQPRGTTHVLLSQNADYLDGLQGILTGNEPYSGEIALNGRRYAVQRAAFMTRTFRMYREQTVIANVLTDLGFRQLGGKKGQRLFSALTEETGLSLDPSRTISQMTITEQKMVELLRIFDQKPELLIIRGLSSFVSVDMFQKMMQLVERLNEAGWFERTPPYTTVLCYPVRISGELALVYNAMSAAGAVERRASLYDEIDDGDDSRKEPTAVGRSAFWGAPRAPMTVAISADGGKSWPWRRNLDEGDGYCMTNNSLEKLNREFSYPSIKQSPDGTLHIAYTWWRQAIKYVRISPEWVKGQAS